VIEQENEIERCDWLERKATTTFFAHMCSVGRGWAWQMMHATSSSTL
jgi:hypothetical protein